MVNMANPAPQASMWMTCATGFGELEHSNPTGAKCLTSLKLTKSETPVSTPGPRRCKQGENGQESGSLLVQLDSLQRFMNWI